MYGNNPDTTFVKVEAWPVDYRAHNIYMRREFAMIGFEYLCNVVYILSSLACCYVTIPLRLLPALLAVLRGYSPIAKGRGHGPIIASVVVSDDEEML